MNLRISWFSIHRWIGFYLAILTSFVVLTGVIAIFGYELDQLFNPDYMVEHQDENYIALGELSDFAINQYPNWRFTRAMLPVSFRYPAQVVMRNEDKPLVRVLLNPYNGEIISVVPFQNVQRLFRDLHRALMLPTTWGIPIVGITAFTMLISLVSGLKAYKKFWRGYSQVPSLGSNKKAISSIHRFISVWSIWFIFLISLTGIWYVIERFGLSAAPIPNVHIVGELTEESMSLYELQQSAQLVFPELEISHISWNQSQSQPVRFMGNQGEWYMRERANFVALNSQNADVVEINKTEHLTFHQFVSEIADPLHFGRFADLTSKIVYATFGVGLLFLCVSGIFLMLKKNVPQKRPWYLLGNIASSGLVLMGLILIGVRYF